MPRSTAFLPAMALCLAVAAGAAIVPVAAWAASGDVETLVFVRHGEKPAEGLGQLDCQGLNRALALPAVIAAKFGKPDAIYAPDPGEKKDDNGRAWNYVRPLATIEPTAIAFGMPVQTPYGYSQIEQLGNTLVDPSWRNKTVVVAWEHRLIEQLVRRMVTAHGGNPKDVPKWASNDFDSIYVLKLDWRNGSPQASFKHDHEGLDGRATDCPCAALPGGDAVQSSASGSAAASAPASAP